jgi:hypothetical protein
MHIDEFAEELIQDIKNFAEYWKKENQGNEPELWPLELPGGDWMDHFLLHLQPATYEK